MADGAKTKERDVTIENEVGDARNSIFYRYILLRCISFRFHPLLPPRTNKDHGKPRRHEYRGSVLPYFRKSLIRRWFLLLADRRRCLILRRIFNRTRVWSGTVQTLEDGFMGFLCRLKYNRIFL